MEESVQDVVKIIEKNKDGTIRHRQPFFSLLNCQLHLQYKLGLVCEDSKIHTVDKSSRKQGWHFLIRLFED